MKLGIVMFVVWVCLIVGVSGQHDLENETSECLDAGEEILERMTEDGFSVKRVEDGLRQARNLFEAQRALREKGGDYDFSNAISVCRGLEEVFEGAYEARDEIVALEIFYNESFYDPEFDTKGVDLIVDEIKSEFYDERYEKISPLVDKAYEEMIRVEAEYTTVNVFYRTTARGFRVFFERYWKSFVFSCLFIAFIVIIYNKAISRFLIGRKINLLELRKKTLKEIIQKTQKDYFQDGKISEGEFNIKTKKIAELIRDIDRKIPLLKERLVKLKQKKK